MRFLKLAALAASLLVLPSCGGGGGSSSGAGGNTLSGTAATGAPIVAGTVTLKDSVGATASTTTDANGNYSFDVGAKQFPLMLKVQPNVTGAVPLFSAALTWGTANTNPLTTLQVFEAVGRTDPSQIYNSGDFSKIGKTTLDQGKLTVTSNLATQFVTNGLDLTTHDPITTPMFANGVGIDAVFDHTNVAIFGNEATLTDSNGNCLDYGPHNVVTFAVDGMAAGNFAAFFGAPPLAFSSVMDVQYVKNSLVKVCVPGIDQPRPFAPNFTNPSVMSSNVIWTRNPGLYDTYDSPTSAVKQLKIQLRDANTRNKLAIQRGGVEGPINIVAHSWGTVVAYIALTELAVEDPTIKVANLITMGSPIQYLSDSSSTAILRIGSLGVINRIQASVPVEFRAKPIVQPNNVTTWTNFWNDGDIISSAIGSAFVVNQPVADCPAPPSSGTAGSTPMLASLCSAHSVYYDVGNAFTVAPTLSLIRSLIERSSVEQLPASTPVVSPPLLTTPAPPPLAFSLTVGTPYCDTNSPVGPAVKLTWDASDGAAYYRVFRNDSAIGVNLVASQLNFQNNLGLVAGQTYSYRVQAMNANGATWSNTAQVAIPVDVCGSSSSLNFTSPSLGNITASSQGYQPTLTASGNVIQISFSWSGATSGSTTWVKNDANWLSKVTTNPDGSITLRPVVTQTGDPSGTTNWTVTLRDGTGATQSQSFAVNYQPSTVAVPTITLLSASPSSIASGATSTLNWASTNSTSCALYNTTATSGTVTLTTPAVANGTANTWATPALTANATYTLRCSGGAGDITQQSVTVAVAAPATAIILNLISPNPITQGTSYQNVTFSGSGFTTSSWPQYSVSSGSSWAWATSAPTYNSPTSMTVAVNNTVAQTIYWRVCASNGSTSCSDSQAVTVQPAAVSIPATPSGTATSGVIGTLSGPGPVTPSSTVNMSWNSVSGTGVDYNLIVTDVTSNTQALNIRLPGNTYTTALTAGHQYRWIVAACNATGCSPYTAAQYFQTPSSTPALSISTTSLPSATVGTGYAQGVAVSGGQTPYTWYVSSSLPSGLYINSTTGAIYGTPTASGTFYFTVTAYDSSSPQKAASQALSLTVGSAVVSLTVNGVTSSYIGAGQKTIPLTGSGFNSLSQISWSCTMPNGTTPCTGSPYVWTPGTTRWNNVTIASDTAATVYPTFLIASDSPGTYYWNVTFSGGGQSVIKYFTVTK